MNIFIHICWVWQMYTPVWPMPLSRYGSCPLPRGFSMPLPGQSRPSLQRQPLCRFFPTTVRLVSFRTSYKGNPMLCTLLWKNFFHWVQCIEDSSMCCMSVCSFLMLRIPEQKVASLFIQSATGGTWWIQGVRERMILSLQNKNTS